eukprot:105692-Pelagomonas_calceolata.AAC.1
MQLTAPSYPAEPTFSSTAKPGTTIYGPIILSLHPPNRPMDVLSMSSTLRALNEAFFTTPPTPHMGMQPVTFI